DSHVPPQSVEAGGCRIAVHVSFSGTAFAPCISSEQVRTCWIPSDTGRTMSSHITFAAVTVLTSLALSAMTPMAEAAQAQQPAPATQAQPQTPPTPAATAPAAAATAEYRISRGDKLRVEVYKDTYLSQSLQVRPDGRITLPLVGDLVAEGLTSIELRDRIANSLKEYVANPVVTVIVVEVVEPVVYVMGEVNQPGSIPMRGPMTVMQALAVAGGFKE